MTNPTVRVRVAVAYDAAGEAFSTSAGVVECAAAMAALADWTNDWQQVGFTVCTADHDIPLPPSPAVVEGEVAT